MKGGSKLICHPATPCAEGVEVAASVALTELQLRVRYRLAGAPLVALPAVTAPKRADGLWEHTCFELFVSVPGQQRYLEINAAPSNEWAMYGFSAYRERENTPELRRQIATVVEGSLCYLDLAVELGPWLGDRPDSLDVGPTAVIEERCGRLSYWALTHPGDVPDFHRPEPRVLSLAVEG